MLGKTIGGWMKLRLAILSVRHVANATFIS